MADKKFKKSPIYEAMEEIFMRLDYESQDRVLKIMEEDLKSKEQPCKNSKNMPS